MELAVHIITKAMRMLENQQGLHLRENYKAQIFASWSEDTGVTIDTIVFQAREGLIHVNRQDTYLISGGGVGKTLYHYKGWNEFLAIREEMQC